VSKTTLWLGICCAAMLLALSGGVARRRRRNARSTKSARKRRRALTGQLSLIGLDPADVRDALAPLHTRDPDEWAASWSRVADRYMADAAANPRKPMRTMFVPGGCIISRNGRCRHRPASRLPYQKALDAYARHTAGLDPKVETVRIPFEGGTITGYLRLPKARPARCR